MSLPFLPGVKALILIGFLWKQQAIQPTGFLFLICRSAVNRWGFRYRCHASVSFKSLDSHSYFQSAYLGHNVPEEFLHLMFFGVVGDLVGDASGSASSLWLGSLSLSSRTERSATSFKQSDGIDSVSAAHQNGLLPLGYLAWTPKYPPSCPSCPLPRLGSCSQSDLTHTICWCPGWSCWRGTWRSTCLHSRWRSSWGRPGQELCPRWWWGCWGTVCVDGLGMSFWRWREEGVRRTSCWLWGSLGALHTAIYCSDCWQRITPVTWNNGGYVHVNQRHIITSIFGNYNTTGHASLASGAFIPSEKGTIRSAAKMPSHSLPPSWRPHGFP